MKIKFLATQFLFKNFILQPLFQPAQEFNEKREGSGSVLVTTGSGCGSGRPENARIRNTAFACILKSLLTYSEISANLN
jgi:hypothetical protein